MSIYEVIHAGDVLSWPEGMKALTTFRNERRNGTGPVHADEQPRWVARLLADGAPEGQRNDAATRLAGYFRSVGLPRDIAAVTMRSFAERCTPPMAEPEINAVIASAWRYQPTAQRTYQGQVMEAPIMDASSQTARIFRWPESGVMVKVERLRDTGRRLECWITIATAALGKVYGPIGLDLLSNTQRDSLRRTLRDRDEQDWTAIIQHVADLVIQSLDPAEELIDLSKHRREVESPWLVEPFVRQRQPYVIYSDGGEGKTTFLLAVMLTMAGVPVLPNLTIPEPVTSMMLDWESDRDETWDIVTALCDGIGADIPEGRLLYRRFSGALTDHLDAIQRDVAEHDVRFVGTDSIIAAIGESDRPSTAARNYFDAMRTLGVASWGVTHLTKDDQGRSAKPYGSVYFWNLARGVWRLKRDQEDGEDTADVGLFQEKFNRGSRHKPIGYTVDYSDEVIRFRHGDVTAMPEIGKRASTGDQIAAVLSRGSMTLQAIYDELPHVNEATIRQTLNRKTKEPRFQNLGERGWGLVTRHNSHATRHTGGDVTEGVLRTPLPASQPSPPEIRLPYKDDDETEDKEYVPWPT